MADEYLKATGQYKRDKSDKHLKVKDLILLLQRFDPERVVCVEFENVYFALNKDDIQMERDDVYGDILVLNS